MPLVQVHEAWSGQSGPCAFKSSSPKPLGLSVEGLLSPSEYGVEFSMGFPTPPRSNEAMLARVAH